MIHTHQLIKIKLNQILTFSLLILFLYRTGNEKPDLTTWKLVIQKCLQQKQGVFGGSIEFDILENDVIKGFETVIRVHFQDRQDFVESISTCVFDEDNVNFHGGRSLRIIAQSASLDGVVVPRHGWEQQEPN